MSWFGGGGDTSSSSSSSSSYDSGSSSSQWSEPSSGAGNYSAGQTSQQSFQEQIQLEAQKIEIQGLILQLTATAFDKCVTKPSSSLSNSESSCIEATIGKNIEARTLLMQKMTG
jgi:import inner membrane translocase subunit TIM13